MHIVLLGLLAVDLLAIIREVKTSGDTITCVRENGVPTAPHDLNEPAPDLVFCDIGNLSGPAMQTVHEEATSVPVVACGVSAAPSVCSQAIRNGATEYLCVPPNPEIVRRIIDISRTSGEPVVGKNSPMQALLHQVRQVARSDASVLICGESGTGKEVLAKYIHLRSARRERPFVAVNCAAIPDTLLESELFGHEKGAFSGAHARRIGKFEAANTGTILLDEVSEMPTRLQAKLLRVLQEREVDRIGGGVPVKIDVRVIATTNRDLPAELDRGTFREDLYFRLNVIPLHIPPLRERRSDIDVLAALFAKKFSDSNGLPRPVLCDTALECLRSYDWPGNVRELENVMHRSVLLGSESIITGSVIEANLPKRLVSRAPSRAAFATHSLVGQTVDALERELVVETVRHTSGNRTLAATMLGISVRTLRNKLKTYATEHREAVS